MEINETPEKLNEKSKRKKLSWKKRFFLGILLLFVILAICDVRLEITKYSIDSPKVEKPIKIALITDLHGNNYGKNQSTLIEAINKENPDVIMLVGDIFDDKISYEKSEETIAILSDKYKCYYVTGNHEYWSKDIGNILNIIRSYNVTVLCGDVDTIEINGQMINICGVDDPDDYVYMAEGETIEEQLQRINKTVDRDYFTILLSHRPEYYDLYSQEGYDLVLSGHAHGGQWRIPILLENGLFAPDQGFFPKYTSGVYGYDGGSLIVSRGLDRQGVLAPRIFNRPELVIIELK